MSDSVDMQYGNLLPTPHKPGIADDRVNTPQHMNEDNNNNHPGTPGGMNPSQLQCIQCSGRANIGCVFQCCLSDCPIDSDDKHCSKHAKSLKYSKNKKQYDHTSITDNIDTLSDAATNALPLSSDDTYTVTNCNHNVKINKRCPQQACRLCCLRMVNRKHCSEHERVRNRTSTSNQSRRSIKEYTTTPTSTTTNNTIHKPTAIRSSTPVSNTPVNKQLVDDMLSTPMHIVDTVPYDEFMAYTFTNKLTEWLSSIFPLKHIDILLPVLYEERLDGHRLLLAANESKHALKYVLRDVNEYYHSVLYDELQRILHTKSRPEADV